MGYENANVQTGELTKWDDNVSDSPDTTALVQVETERAITEVRAQLQIAQMFPRDEQRAYTRIMKACKRFTLAEKALYSYKRGQTIVKGESIRLVEEIARCWGNINYGFRELSHDMDRSEIEAFAHDLETNTRISRSFYVRHYRDKGGKVVELTSQRDKYEHVASQAQRRVRAVITELIPGDIIEAARKACEKTLREGDGSKSFDDRVRDMLLAFEDYGITKPMIESFFGHKIDAIIPDELVRLTEVYRSIRDGVADRTEFFDLSVTKFEPGTVTKAEDKKPKDKGKEKAPEAKDKTPEPKPEPESKPPAKDPEPEPEKEIEKAEPVTPGPEQICDPATWSKLKTKGFVAFIKTNLETIAQHGSDEVINQMGEKWKKLYPGLPFPLANMPKDESEPEDKQTEIQPPEETPEPEKEKEPEGNAEEPTSLADIIGD